MNKSTFFDLVKKPELLNEESLPELMAIVNEYPWFQAGRILLVKNMHVLDHVRYNSELKVAAANIPDRDRLFDLIQNVEVKVELNKARDVKENLLQPDSYDDSIQTELEQKSEVSTENQSKAMVTSSAPVGIDYFQVDDVYDTSDGKQVNFSLPVDRSLKKEQLDDIVLPSADFLEYDSNEIVSYQLTKTVDFKKVKDENRSFSDWLNVLKHAPLAKEEEPVSVKKSRQLIDSFLNTNSTRIVPKKEDADKTDQPDKVELKARLAMSDRDDLMSETLAGIYIRQKHYDKAIGIFEKLCLKYPEKNVYFAQRISDLEKLINNQ